MYERSIFACASTSALFCSLYLLEQTIIAALFARSRTLLYIHTRICTG